MSGGQVVLTEELLMAAMPGLDDRGVAARWVQPLQDAMDEYGISATVQRAAAFLAQIGHESAGLRVLEENLNYSANGLARVWPKRFALPDGSPNALALEVQRKPERIANIVYANRMGNGPEESGDGWRYRGRGPIQVTGKANYRVTQVVMPGYVNIVENPDMLARSEVCGARSAAYYWARMGVNAAVDDDDWDRVCDLINLGRPTPTVGDSAGYRDRLSRFELALRVLNGGGAGDDGAAARVALA